ncbi:hypothetical protein DHX103_10990 [Planococcus sp. X10-3]|uniref:hypothetical protein n=1 Tax=Planococcus sp. X10-3 TaxID=3061240 RepID=UPI003BAFCB7F
MGNRGDHDRNSNNSSNKNGEFKQLENNNLKRFIQKVLEAIDEMLIRGTVPSPKLLNFLCIMADGQYITNEELKELENRVSNINGLQEQNDNLKIENQALKAMNDNLQEKSADMEIQMDKIKHRYLDIEKKLEERSKKIDSSSINGIVTFE